MIAVEGNAPGQFSRLIRRETGFHITKQMLRYDGLPITPEYILKTWGIKMVFNGATESWMAEILNDLALVVSDTPVLQHSGFYSSIKELTHGHLEEYGNFETAWCPGCGNFFHPAGRQAGPGRPGIKAPGGPFCLRYRPGRQGPPLFKGQCFQRPSWPIPAGGHRGQIWPTRIWTVIVESGDGCNYGEGGNHFLAAIRRNSQSDPAGS